MVIIYTEASHADKSSNNGPGGNWLALASRFSSGIQPHYLFPYTVLLLEFSLNLAVTSYTVCECKSLLEGNPLTQGSRLQLTGCQRYYYQLRYVS